DRSELLDDACDGRLHFVALRYVALDRRRAPPQLRDLARRRLAVDEPLRACGLRERPVLGGVFTRIRLDLDVGDHDVRTGARQRQRVGPAKPARAAGDERDAAGEVDLERHAAESYSRGIKSSRAMTRRWICEV